VDRMDAVMAVGEKKPKPLGEHLAGLEAEVFFSALCCVLSVVYGSMGPLALAGCIHCAALLLSKMTACEERWNHLEASFVQWRQQETANDSLTKLQKLLSRDGPWRGNYEDAVHYTRLHAGQPKTQAAALALALCSLWWSAELLYGGTVQEDVLLCAATTWTAALVVLWKAATLTSKMQDQSVHLYELHRMAVEIVAGVLHSSDSGLVEQVQRAHSEFQLEYNLIREFMTVQKWNAGFTLLECRISRGHAMTLTTAVVPSIVKSVCVRPEVSALASFQQLGWIAIATVTFASALCTLCASSSRSSSSCKWIQSGSQLLQSFAKQKPLIVVLAALVAHTMQRHLW